MSWLCIGWQQLIRHTRDKLQDLADGIRGSQIRADQRCSGQTPAFAGLVPVRAATNPASAAVAESTKNAVADRGDEDP